MPKIDACLKRAAKAALALCLGFVLSLGLGREARALYDVKPGEASGRPGSIIRVWPLEGGGPGGGDAFRILYRSTGLSGEPIAVSGAIFIPPGAAPAGGRNVIAWAHPTSGVVEDCAPSLMPDVSGMIWGLADMLRQGYVVVATDYPGLGVPGMIHPYLIGVSEGRAVLDSVRAARDLPDAGASNRFAVWGHSQGGHASLYTGELAASYAPDLKLVGVAAAAPATYLAELFDADKSSPGGKELTAMTIYSWSRLSERSGEQPRHGRGHAGLSRRSRRTASSRSPSSKPSTRPTKPLAGEQFLKANPTEVEPWRSTHAQEHSGPGAGRRAGVPRARHRRHHRQARDHQAIRRSSLQPRHARRASSSFPASRIPSPPRTACRPALALDGRPLQGRAGAIELPSAELIADLDHGVPGAMPLHQ